MNTTTLYILCGLPGAGKTTYARRLAEKTDAKLFILDELMHTRYGNAHRCDLQIREYATKYEILPQIEDTLETQQSVILDFGFYKKEERERYRKLTALHAVSTETHYLTASYDTLLERVTARNTDGNNIHHIDKEILDVLISRFEAPKDDEPHICITTD